MLVEGQDIADRCSSLSGLPESELLPTSARMPPLNGYNSTDVAIYGSVEVATNGLLLWPAIW